MTDTRSERRRIAGENDPQFTVEVGDGRDRFDDLVDPLVSRGVQATDVFVVEYREGDSTKRIVTERIEATSPPPTVEVDPADGRDAFTVAVSDVVAVEWYGPGSYYRDA